MEFEWHLVVRLLVAAGLGAAIGLEREASDQPAGLRTHLAVAVGAALFGVISTTGFTEFETTQRATNIQFDVTRVASIVVSGIGFLGAGLIFRRGSQVLNLTTAASMWVVCAIGLSCGVGDFSPAIACTVIVLVALVVLRMPRAWVREYLRADEEPLRVVLLPGADEHPVLAALEAVDGVSLHSVSLEKDHGRYVLTARVRADRNVQLRERLFTFPHRDDVDTFVLGEPFVD